MKHDKAWLTAFAAVFVALGAQAVDYEVTGTVEGMDGETVYMTDYFMDNAVIDSAKVVDGRFRFHGTYDREAFVRVESGRLFSNCVLEDVPVAVDFATHAPSAGGDHAAVVREYMARRIALNEEFDSVASALQARYADERTLRQEYKKYYDEVFPPYMEYIKGIVTGNPDGAGEMALMEFGGSCSPVQWEEIYARLSPTIKQLPLTQKFNGMFSSQIRTSVGKMFVDLSGKTVDGAEARLSDYVGKGRYVLVDFYASWCGPCRQEARETLKPLYERYKDDSRFTILGVATWDGEDDSKRVIADEGYHWPQIIGAGMAPMEAYGFNGIPMIMLFAPDGTILARDIRGAAVFEAVENALGENEGHRQ